MPAVLARQELLSQPHSHVQAIRELTDMQVMDGASTVKGNYVFNRVFDSAHDQAAVYEGTAKPYV